MCTNWDSLKDDWTSCDSDLHEGRVQLWHTSSFKRRLKKQKWQEGIERRSLQYSMVCYFLYDRLPTLINKYVQIQYFTFYRVIMLSINMKSIIKQNTYCTYGLQQSKSNATSIQNNHKNTAYENGRLPFEGEQE